MYSIKGFQIIVAKKEVVKGVHAITNNTYELIGNIGLYSFDSKVFNLVELALKDLSDNIDIAINIINDDDSIHPYKEMRVTDGKVKVSLSTSSGKEVLFYIEDNEFWEKLVRNHTIKSIHAYVENIRDLEARA